MSRRVESLIALAFAATFASPSIAAPSTVRIVHNGRGYHLEVDGQPFVIRGAGLQDGNQEELAARGGNAFRTWRPGDDPKAMLDRAQRNGLRVALGIEVESERHGFGYDDEAAVAREVARVRDEALRWRDHPALLMWVVGNELNLDGRNPRVWDAVNRMAAAIHAIDPHHPVTTTLAGVDPAVVAEVKARAPQLDLLGVQLYADIKGLDAKIRASGWTGPYVVTEWGPTGHWESAKTPWGAPIEEDGAQKAAVIGERYAREIAPANPQRVGSFVFLWGNKQERTPTWYGLFLPSGESTPAVDALQLAWTGKAPANRAPNVTSLTIDGRAARAGTVLAAGSSHVAKADVADPDGDRTQARWYVLEESRATSTGGDAETVPSTIDVAFVPVDARSERFVAPKQPGAYRLFLEVRDGRGHAGYANLPFRVDAPRGR
ncbi:glycoside hydrolase family 2 TIM barrel-domain containing protein [Cognatilysobacter terrigena]|uniref:glycoside hydrolase family 2 TIM barrel-domain containing protein n=1 Tax=Cognatilysobacter terrigena TaxID=2488749 RepID=UPI00105E3912|nr:glycoside hydrolase family 2 TIM barrel-domain containing protein [Lysobacter terrigena]